MIAIESQVRAALGLIPTITEAQQARLILAMESGHAAVRKFLRYNPEQSVGPAEYYPKTDVAIENGYGDVWDVNPGQTRAQLDVRSGGTHKYLQLSRLPVRAIKDLRVDPSARHGSQSGDFASGTAWTAGSDYSVEWERPNFSRTGCLVAAGAFPSGLGTVRVTYRAGYSPEEFDGPAEASATASDGTITTEGVDASQIKAAAILASMAAYHELAAWSQSQITGLILPGPRQSEHLGSYSYSIGNAAAASLIAGLLSEIPPKAAQLLSEFQHYGVMVA